MPLPGGPADKFGNRYEGRWTVACIVEIIEERADAIRLEPPGEAGEGVEFWLRRGARREYYQVKRQYTAKGRWTLADLHSNGVLSHFWKKLSDATVLCFFVSTHAADQLGELAERAGDAASWEEFDREFLKASQPSTNFKQLCQYWAGCPPTSAYERLKRIHVRTVDEDFLRTTVESRLAMLVEGDPATVADVLAQLVLDRVHQELTAHDIWYHLQNRGYRRRQWEKDPHVLAAVDAANTRYLSPLRDEAIADEVIPRHEVQTVLQLLTASNMNRHVFLLGEAGVGKSGVVLQVVEALRAQGVPVLAFRVDRLEPAPLPDRVGEQLGLPGSPANVLAAVAQNRACVLVIDQLDAVSLASGRHVQFFDCLSEILKQAQIHPQMRLLLACRKFDLENDHRLRRLTGSKGIAEGVTVGRLPHTTVQEVVTKLGLDAGRLTSRQLDLLSVPLHLSLLAEVARDAMADVLNFETAKDLYDRFWDHKQAVLRERLGRPIQWTAVVDTLCTYMSDQQMLSAPQSLVDEYADDAKAMASEHVLTQDGQRYAFFHEGFFDYAFARRFAARGQEVVAFLRSSEQHLFRRAQVRQILLHEREADRCRYLANIKALIVQPDIRFHLKQVVFSLLTDLNNPAVEEWNVLAPLVEDSTHPCVPKVWDILHRSVPWLRLLDSVGLLERWLVSPDEGRVNLTVMLLSSVQRHLPDRIAEMLEPYVGASDAWRSRMTHVMRLADLSIGRRFLDLFLRLIDEGIFDGAKGLSGIGGDFWELVYTLPGKLPEWACEIVGHYFNRRLVLSLAAGQTNPFDLHAGTIPGSQLDDQIFLESARGAPAAFVTQVLPFMVRVMALTARRTGSPPCPDLVWEYREYGGGYGVDGALLTAMEEALCTLATREPEIFRTIAGQLRELSFETIQYLLIRAYAANGQRFADEAADYLCDLPARLNIGYFGAAHWAARQLLEAITPHCSTERLTRLEEVILAYYAPYEKTASGRPKRGHAQFILLDGIASLRRSVAATRRLEEWCRKFGKQSADAPKPLQGGYVGSPIPESAADKMTDEQWLKAIARYNRDDTRFRSDGRTVGGARELAYLLESQVKQEPARFAALACRFPDTTHPVYFEAVLRGITEADLDLQTALRVCQRCHQLPSRPCGHWINRLIEKLAERPLPREALDLVSWYATEDPDPEQEWWRTTSPGGDVYHGGDILTTAINSVRGSAAEAVRALIFHDGNRLSYFLPTLERMVQDPSIAVRSCVASALIAVLRYDRDLAVGLFRQLCDAEEVLLGTRYVERFLYYALQTHFGSLAAVVKRMVVSDIPAVATAGSRQVCVASFLLEEAHPLALSCISGTEAHQIGAAEVFAANLRTARFRSFCEEALTQLFQSPYEKVHAEAAQCFNGFEGEQLGEYIELVEAFVQSPAFTMHYNYLIRALEKTTAKLPDVTCLVCKRFLDVAGATAADVRTRIAADANRVSQLLVRVYSQSADSILQARCLDLIDRMIQVGAYGLNETLLLYDR